MFVVIVRKVYGFLSELLKPVAPVLLLLVIVGGYYQIQCIKDKVLLNQEIGSLKGVIKTQAEELDKEKNQRKIDSKEITDNCKQKEEITAKASDAKGVIKSIANRPSLSVKKTEENAGNEDEQSGNILKQKLPSEVIEAINGVIGSSSGSEPSGL